MINTLKDFQVCNRVCQRGNFSTGPQEVCMNFNRRSVQEHTHIPFYNNLAKKTCNCKKLSHDTHFFQVVLSYVLGGCAQDAHRNLITINMFIVIIAREINKSDFTSS